MSKRPENDMRRFALGAAIVAAGCAMAIVAYASEKFPGIGRPATRAEIAAWDIDVRPDFKGLPKGSGTVEQGQEIWEGKCASCHGIFGESNQVFTPIIGGTTAEDIKNGRVANLARPDYPQRTTFMKAPTVSTLFDYIRRAMPWNEPKSLSDDDVYAVLAFMLNVAEIVPDDFTLDDKSIREVQNKMPNRHGMSTEHAMWYGTGFGQEKRKPDARNTACMKDCGEEAKIVSSLPDYAWPSHGNIAAQNRRIGPVRGRMTGDTDPDAVDDPSPPEMKLANEAGCMACHAINNKLVGPSYADVSARYRGKDGAADMLVAKLVKGTEGTWGAVAMPPQEAVAEGDLKSIVEWILAGARER